MAPKHIRVLLSFTHKTDHQIEEVAGAVIQGLTGSLIFTRPPVDLAVVQTSLTEFTAAISASLQGGAHATADKNKKRHTLVAMLRQLALYVQANCDDDLTRLLSSGFQAASTTRTQLPLPKPVIARLDHGNSGQMVLRVNRIPNARAYEVLVAPVGTGGAPGEWQKAGSFTSSRIVLDNLIPGTIYAVKVKAVGGATGYSDWSDPVSHMST